MQTSKFVLKLKILIKKLHHNLKKKELSLLHFSSRDSRHATRAHLQLSSEPLHVFFGNFIRFLLLNGICFSKFGITRTCLLRYEKDHKG